MEQSPDFEDALAHAGYASQALGRFEEAETYLRRAVKADPQHREAHQNLAETFRKRGRYEDALPWYKAALRIDPGFALAHAALGNTLFQLQRYDEALDSLAQAVSLRPDLPMAPSLYVLMGRAAQETGQPEAVARHYQDALRIEPQNPEALSRLAILRFEQRRYGEALTLFRAVVENKPGDAQGWSTSARPFINWAGMKRRCAVWTGHFPWTLAWNRRGPIAHRCASGWSEAGSETVWTYPVSVDS